MLITPKFDFDEKGRAVTIEKCTRLVEKRFKQPCARIQDGAWCLQART